MLVLEVECRAKQFHQVISQRCEKAGVQPVNRLPLELVAFRFAENLHFPLRDFPNLRVFVAVVGRLWCFIRVVCAQGEEVG